jgi:hypothetical protein
MTSKYAVDGSCYWFLAKVTNIMDPKEIGRVQIRCFNIHTQDTTILPDDMLLWAYVLLPVTSSGQNGVGNAPVGLKPGSIVKGIFLDGREMQIPLIEGVISSMTDGEPDTNPLARGTNNINKTIIQGSNEPDNSYAAKYPYNQVFQTSSGITVELDDTPNNQRIHIFHPAGSYTEINKDGREIHKVSDDSFDIVVKDKNVFVGGQMTVHVVGDAIVQIDKNCILGVTGSVVADILGDCDINVEGAGNIGVTGDLQLIVEGNSNMTASTWNIKGDVNIDGQVSVSKDVIADGISLKTHKHDEVQSGTDETGEPVKS